MLTFQLTLEDDSEIPEWIDFDTHKLIISGTWKLQESLKLKLMATDVSGNSSNFIFEPALILEEL